ncbi:MAG: radical SAM protein [Candidatus Eisenbacteria bacterium]|uniref:Radical SAM protein n=1 Tax=Eiseniibacteriota bacterium TaxID=2212470 RepID=A0A956SFA8_UNCEI|nr:radical SAM protein [Candidatus Eisenbacteria bacterium]MCB9464240.1 radical SAM protein [Candidatus Eisenbacteria bacterium]
MSSFGREEGTGSVERDAHSPAHAPRRPAAIPVSDSPHVGPELDFLGLDVLWLQVSGTVCNIACRHCFITCGPKNESHPFMTTESVLSALATAEREGVKEYYFTGGEPFLHPDILLLIERTLAQGPLSILTNGLLLTPEVARRLKELSDQSEYSLDLRVSLDGTTPDENDPIRGRGTFDGILAGARHLEEAGLQPVFTVTTVHARYEGSEGRTAFMERLRSLGFSRPRTKFIPPFHIGREAHRAGEYEDGFRLSPGDLAPGEEQVLQCGSCRTVTARGVYPCPILIEEAGARMAEQLEDSFVPIALNHPACATCHIEGFTCRT